jgi:hypothetical protein
MSGLESIFSFIERCQKRTGLLWEEIPQYNSWETAQEAVGNQSLHIVCSSAHGKLCFYDLAREDENGQEFYSRCLVIVNNPTSTPGCMENASGTM